jgi:glycerol-3-phosphate acyltransferase PlsX
MDSKKPIALDAFGSDARPEPELAAVALASAAGLEVDLVGDREQLAARVPSEAAGLVRIIHASDAIAMDESPARAVKAKPDASLNVAMRALRSGQVGALVSAGNSGAIVAAALLGLGRIAGVDRPAILTRVPHLDGATLLLDSGANVECRPLHLVQFAVMGAVVATREQGLVRPRVALLSNGSELGKGTALTRASVRLLDEHRSPHFEFVGPVEPSGLFDGRCDVVVTDGWTGNLVLKTGEAALGLWPRLLARTSANPAADLAHAHELDPDAHGGAPLVGVEGAVIICHGAAGPRALYNALALARRLALAELASALREAIAAHRPLFDAARRSTTESS